MSHFNNGRFNHLNNHGEEMTISVISNPAESMVRIEMESSARIIELTPEAAVKLAVSLVTSANRAEGLPDDDDFGFGIEDDDDFGIKDDE